MRTFVKNSAVAALAVSLVALAAGGVGCIMASPPYEGPLNDNDDETGGNANVGGGSGGEVATGGVANTGGAGNTGGTGNAPPVDEGLVALYTFDEGSGDLVHDTSGVGTPLDLTIPDIAAVEWSAGALHVNTSTLIASEGPATKISEACMASSEVTLEAWIAPLQLNQNGPARIVTLSVDTATRNVTLAQQADLYYSFRLRSALTDLQGQPELQTPTGDADVTTVLSHVVLTRSSTGERAIYVDGELRATDESLGSFDNWDATYQFALANELTGDRPWLGALHHVAIYSRAMDEAEVAAKFAAGEP